MNQHYDRPNAAARAANAVIRRLAEAGVSIAGTQALRVRGRKSGALRSVVVNVLRVGDTEYLVSPRGNAMGAQCAGGGRGGARPRWRRRPVRLTEVDDDAKPALLQRYIDRWYWEVKGHIAGLTPQSTDTELRSAAPAIPVFALAR